jgi:hypothetical protein
LLIRNIGHGLDLRFRFLSNLPSVERRGNIYKTVVEILQINDHLLELKLRLLSVSNRMA